METETNSGWSQDFLKNCSHYPGQFESSAINAVTCGDFSMVRQRDFVVCHLCAPHVPAVTFFRSGCRCGINGNRAGFGVGLALGAAFSVAGRVASTFLHAVGGFRGGGGRFDGISLLRIVVAIDGAGTVLIPGHTLGA